VVSTGAKKVSQMRRVVREVGVHLEDEVILPLESPPETGDVRRPKAELLGAPKNVNARVRRDNPVDDLPCSVGRPVVYNEDLEARILGQHRLGQASDVFSLVVRRDDDERAFRARLDV
jgi:hypothetical protein